MARSVPNTEATSPRGARTAQRIIALSTRFRFVLSFAAGVFLFFARDHLPFPFPHLMIVALTHVGITLLIFVWANRSPDRTRIQNFSLYADSMMAGPTVLFSGGFISPLFLFAFLGGIASGLQARTDHRFSRNNMLIVLVGYLSVSILQKYNVLPNHVEYSRSMMEHDFFFWTVVGVVVAALAGGNFLFKNFLQWRLTDITEAYQRVSEGAGQLSGEELFVPMAHNLATTLAAPAAFIGEYVDNGDSLRVLALWESGQRDAARTIQPVPDQLRPPSRGEMTAISEITAVEQAAREFGLTSPDYRRLHTMGLFDSKNCALGILGVFGARELMDEEVAQAFSRILAVRAGVELERARTEQEKTAIEEQLMQSRKLEAVGQLAGGVAHDFNNHLGAIVGYAELLLLRLKDNELARYPRTILEVAHRAADLTRQLLSFARRGKYRREPVDMHEIVVSGAGILRHTVDRKISISQRLDADESVVIGDASQYQNALLNLGLNARDAMPGGGELTYSTRNVELSADQLAQVCGTSTAAPGRFLEVAVSDTGHGIPPEIVSRVFEPFFTTKSAGKGTGLGLAAVYGCVKGQGGAVAVESTPEQGTTFRLYFPVSSDESRVPQDEKKPLRSPKVDNAGICAMVVDDEQDILDSLSTVLGEHGLDVRTFSRGAEAVEHYRSRWQQIDCVVLDIVMPDLSGDEVLKLLQEINPSVQVILATGYAGEETAERLLNSGAGDLIQKPFEATDLVDRIHTLRAKTQPG